MTRKSLRQLVEGEDSSGNASACTLPSACTWFSGGDVEDFDECFEELEGESGWDDLSDDDTLLGMVTGPSRRGQPMRPLGSRLVIHSGASNLRQGRALCQGMLPSQVKHLSWSRR